MYKILSILNILFNIVLIFFVAQVLIFSHLGIISIILGLISEIFIFLNFIKKPIYNNFSKKILYIFLINLIMIVNLKWLTSPKLINVNIASNYKFIVILSLLLALLAFAALIFKVTDNTVSNKNNSNNNVSKETKKTKVIKKETTNTVTDKTKQKKIIKENNTNNSSNDEDDYI